MRIWDDEIEALRPTLRVEAAAFLAGWPSTNGDDASASVEQRVAAARSAGVGANLTSDRGVDRTIEGPAGPLRLRTFTPKSGNVDGVMLHIHGGAFMMGEPEMMDLLNEIIADSVDVAVVSVDYRLAPEHPYPAAIDDCEAAAVWLVEHAEAEYGSARLLIGGESAGGHLAAATLLRMRDRHQAVDRFLGANLVFGIYDLSRTPSQYGIGIEPENDILAADPTTFWIGLFTPGMTMEQRRDPGVSPLWAGLHDLVPALFTVGGNDHLLDDTLFLSQRWDAAGNRTELLVYPDTPHGCIALPSVGAHWFPRMLDFLRGCLKG